jgi:hypothetical protein
MRTPPTLITLSSEHLIGLDHAVLDAYGRPHDLTEEDILRQLLQLNYERAEAAKASAEAVPLSRE